MKIVVRPVGELVDIPFNVNRAPEFDFRTGNHLWGMIGFWKCDPEKAISTGGLLDHENLLLLDGPACYYCEQEYSPRLKNLRCKGKP